MMWGSQVRCEGWPCSWASLEIMQIVLAGSLAFDIIDRLHGLYLGIAGEVTVMILHGPGRHSRQGVIHVVILV